MPNALTMDHVTHRYGPTLAVSDMSWSARTGRITAVLGPNGAGKSTSLALAQGLLKPTSGRIDVLGSNPWEATAEHRAKVGVMLQDGGLPNLITPRRLLRHVASLYANPLPYEELVQRLDLGDFDRRIVRRLSGGQRQRVALAAAIVGQPELIFLDEPTAGLDPHARRNVWSLIAALRDEGRTVILATHHFDEAERLADDVVIVHRGSMVATGETTQVAGEDGLESIYFHLTDTHTSQDCRP